MAGPADTADTSVVQNLLQLRQNEEPLPLQQVQQFAMLDPFPAGQEPCFRCIYLKCLQSLLGQPTALSYPEGVAERAERAQRAQKRKR